MFPAPPECRNPLAPIAIRTYFQGLSHKSYNLSLLLNHTATQYLKMRHDLKAPFAQFLTPELL